MRTDVVAHVKKPKRVVLIQPIPISIATRAHASAR